MLTGVDTSEAKRLGAKRKRLLNEAEAISERLREHAADMLRAGLAPAEVKELTGYSAAQVRIIARTAGVGPARPGPRPKEERT